MITHHLTRRRSAVVAAALVASAAGVGIVLTTSAEAAGPSYPRHLVAHQAASAPVDIPPTGDSAGDEFADVYTLSTSNGRRAGSLTQVCTLVDAEHGLAQCVGTVRLAKGRLTFAGAVDGSRVSRMAVTGGTGALTGAGGVATFTSHPSSVTVALRLEDRR